MKLFLDEAGHTGKHLFDAAQPVFVYAGVWLDDETQLLVRDRMSFARKKHGFTAKEHKGSKLISSARGRLLVHDSLEPCFNSFAPVSVAFFNKPFQAAAVVVEDCTDYAHNSAFEERWTWDTRLKAPLAQKIFAAANHSQLMDVWRTRLGPREDFVNAYKRLLLALELNQDRTLSDLAHEMGRTDFNAIWELNHPPSATNPPYSPNFNTFVSTINGADRQAALRNLNQVHVVHDEQAEYQTSLSYLFGLLRDAQPGEVSFPNGNTFRTPLDRLHSLSFASSSTELGLQLADFVASCARAIIASSSFQPGALSSVARWLLEGGDEIFPHVFGPTVWQDEVFRSILRVAG